MTNYIILFILSQVSQKKFIFFLLYTQPQFVVFVEIDIRITIYYHTFLRFVKNY